MNKFESIYQSPTDCSWLIKFHQFKNHSSKDFFSFCDAIFIQTVNKETLTNNQQSMIKNINRLGCGHRTYWCLTRGYRNCHLSSVDKNLAYNMLIIFKFCLQRNFKNVLLLEDDLIVTKHLWKNYSEKKKSIEVLLKIKERIPLILHFGYFPLLSIRVSKYLSRGLNMNAHCVLYNRKALQKFTVIYNHFLKTSSSIFNNVDRYYLSRSYFQKYSLIPNNIFFQKSDKNSVTGSSKYYQILCQGQKLFTRRIYYQYDPKFVSYWEPFSGFSILTILILIIFIILVIVLLHYSLS